MPPETPPWIPSPTPLGYLKLCINARNDAGFVRIKQLFFEARQSCSADEKYTLRVKRIYATKVNMPLSPLA